MNQATDRRAEQVTPKSFATVVASVLGIIAAGSAVVFNWAPAIGDAFVTDALPTWYFFGFAVVGVGLLAWLLYSWRARRLYADYEELQFRHAGLEQRMLDLEEEAITDVVTGTPNQKKLTQDIERLKASSRRWQIIFIDFDDFGAVNEQFGRLGGDRVIRHVARGMFESIRRNEFMYRLYSGGDEFLLLVEGDVIDAIGLLNRVCLRVKELSSSTLKLVGSPGVELSFTAGVATLKRDDTVESARQTVEDCYKVASHCSGAENGRAIFRVYWPPEMLNGVDTESPPASTVLERNRELFHVANLDVEDAPRGVPDSVRDRPNDL